jgi:hypothetical protein
MAKIVHGSGKGLSNESNNTKNMYSSNGYKFIKFLILGIIFYFILNWMNETDPRDEFATQKFGAAGFVFIFFVRSAYHLFKSIFG